MTVDGRQWLGSEAKYGPIYATLADAGAEKMAKTRTKKPGTRKKARRPTQQPTLKRPFIRDIAPPLELVAIACVLFAMFYPRIQNAEFHGDESLWIATSYYFEAFVSARLDSPVWNESYETLTQPPVGRYVVGLGRSLGGYGIRDLNRPWNFNLSDEENVARGHKPSPGLLWWSRFPMCLLAIICCLIAFYLVKDPFGRLAGYLTIGFFALNPYFSDTMLRAMGEAPVLAATMVAMLAGDRAVRRLQVASSRNQAVGRRFVPVMIWLVIMGLFIGIAAATKLNGASSLVAGVGLCLVIPFVQSSAMSSLQLLSVSTFAVVALILAAAFTFVALNPYLYRHPVRRTEQMVQQRISEMDRQQAAMPSARIDGPAIRRLLVIADRVFHEYAFFSFTKSWIVNGILCVAGLLWSGFVGAGWLRGQRSSGGNVVLLLIAFSASAPILMTPLDWNRYYLFPVFFSTVFIAVGSVWIIENLARWTTRRVASVRTKQA